MQKKLNSLSLLLLCSVVLFGQAASVKTSIKSVENGLIPYVPVQGFPAWNIYERMKHYKVPGVSIAVVNNFKLEWAKGYGLADTLKKTPVTPQTMFSAGSISKLVMAAAAFQLIQEQKISLDEPINQYLKSWKIPENDYTRQTPITLRMLLSHTAGTSQTSYFGFTPDNKNLPSILDILSGQPNAESRGVVVNSEPKKEFRYSGGGSMIAQMALMDVSGERFEALCDRVLFQPLGMPQSTFAQPLPSKFQAQAAWGYSYASWYEGMPYVYPQQAAAGLYATPSDLARFLIEIQQALRGKGKVLSPASAQTMVTPVAKVSEGGFREEIGVGPFLLQRIDNQDPQGRYFEFTGVNAGFVAYLIGNITEGYGAVIMLNTGDDFNGLGKEIRRAIAQTYGWHNFLPPAVQPSKWTKAELERVVGRYRLGPDEVMSFQREGDHLIQVINSGSPIPCFPIANDSIVLTDFNVKAHFRFDSQGRSSSFQSAYQTNPILRMAADEFTPTELINAQRLPEAKALIRTQQLNVYQITYKIYELLNRKPVGNFAAAKMLLELAEEQHPQSAIVFARWGDYYLKMQDRAAAIRAYERANQLDPSDEGVVKVLGRLK
ncbi:serine hydrolase [Haliscomenobacter sp.]|uniref:serine hydrolase n=1 Tax=Haliscomenobacter sp. TaxID=2717303 RepID=UPI0035941125